MAKIDSIKVDANEEGTKNKKKTTKKSRAVVQKKNTADKSAKTSKKNNALTLITIIIIATALIVGGGIYLWQNSVSQKNIDQAKEEASNTVTDFFQKKLSEIESKLQGVESENTELKTANEELESKAKLLDQAKKQFTSEELGLTFLYPAIFGEVELSFNDGVRGEIFRGKFSNFEGLVFGGISQDFSTPRNLVFTDTWGYKKTWKNYYFKTANGTPVTDNEITPVKIVEYKNGKAIIVDTASFIAEEKVEDEPKAEQTAEEDKSAILHPGEGNLGAIVDLEGKIFSGIAFWDKDVENFSQEEFEAMIETVEVE